MSPIKVLLVRVDGTAEVQSVEPDLDVFQELVGGYIEHVAWDGGEGPGGAYVDEEGLLRGLPLNRRASQLLGQPLVGPAVFVGPVDDEGYETDVPAEILALAGVSTEA